MGVTLRKETLAGMILDASVSTLEHAEIVCYTGRTSDTSRCDSFTAAVSITPTTITNWGSYVYNQDGTVGVNHVLEIAGVDGTPNTITGIGVFPMSYTPSSIPLGYEDFNAPIPLTDSHSVISMSVKINLDPLSNLGSITLA